MRRASWLLLAAIALAAPSGHPQDWSADWSTMDGGGEIEASGGAWSVSGAVGQWDATSASRGTGGSWEVTGGFWPVDLPTDVLFRDGFES